MTAERMIERLIAYRKAQGLSQKALALKSNLTPSTLCTIENGYYYPSMDSFFALCRGLGITPAQFFLSDTESEQLYTSDEQQLLDFWNTMNSENKKICLSFFHSVKEIQDGKQ